MTNNLLPRPRVSHPHFQPAEVEAITGLDPAVIRNWRKRGHISKHLDRGEEGFSVDALCGLFALKKLSDIGVGPAAVSWRVLNIADGVFAFALQDRHVWDSKEAFEAQRAIDESEPQQRPGRFYLLNPVTGSFNATDDLSGALPLNATSGVTIVIDRLALGRELAQRCVEADKFLCRFCGWTGAPPDAGVGFRVTE
jgi:hypothetical protein